MFLPSLWFIKVCGIFLRIYLVGWIDFSFLALSLSLTSIKGQSTQMDPNNRAGPTIKFCVRMSATPKKRGNHRWLLGYYKLWICNGNPLKHCLIFWIYRGNPLNIVWSPQNKQCNDHLSILSSPNARLEVVSPELQDLLPAMLIMLAPTLSTHFITHRIHGTNGIFTYMNGWYLPVPWMRRGLHVISFQSFPTFQKFPWTTCSTIPPNQAKPGRLHTLHKYCTCISSHPLLLGFQKRLKCPRLSLKKTTRLKKKHKTWINYIRYGKIYILHINIYIHR